MNLRRLFCNAPGDFYSTGQNPIAESDDLWFGDCLRCRAPEWEAPDLLALPTMSNGETHFVRQPASEEEVARACAALKNCCVYALRYGGRDRQIIRLLDNNPGYCDYVINVADELVYCLDDNGDLLPWAAAIRDAVGAGKPRPPMPATDAG